jgi:hypothetical protein
LFEPAEAAGGVEGTICFLREEAKAFGLERRGLAMLEMKGRIDVQEI